MYFTKLHIENIDFWRITVHAIILIRLRGFIVRYYFKILIKENGI